MCARGVPQCARVRAVVSIGAAHPPALGRISDMTVQRVSLEQVLSVPFVISVLSVLSGPSASFLRLPTAHRAELRPRGGRPPSVCLFVSFRARSVLPENKTACVRHAAAAAGAGRSWQRRRTSSFTSANEGECVRGRGPRCARDSGRKRRPVGAVQWQWPARERGRAREGGRDGGEGWGGGGDGGY